MSDLLRAIAGVVGRDIIPHGRAIGDIFPDPIAAQNAWVAAGGRNSGLKVAPVGDGTWTHIPDPNFQPGQSSGPVAPAPQGYGGVGTGMGPPSIEPVPSSNFMDRRGLPGRDPLGPRVPTGLVDPEGRPLYQGALIAGQRTAGGPDTPLTILEEIALNKILSHGDFQTPNYIPGAKGRVVVKQGGTVGSQALGVPPTPPLLRIEVDASRPDADYAATMRHEGGHALDFWTFRTQYGTGVMRRQHAIPDDVRLDLTSNSQEMRPDIWAPEAPSKGSYSEPQLHEYRNRPDELMADGYRAYKEDPAGFKAKYPNAAAYIRAMVNDDPLLSQHIQFNAKAGIPVPAEVPTETKQPDTDPIGDYRFPVGNIPLPGGLVLNDLLKPFTDSRSDDRLLPGDLSLNDIGRSLAGLSPGAQVKSHMEAQAGRTVEGEEIGSFARLMGLFPAAGANASVAPAGRNTVGAAIFRRAEEMPAPISTEGFRSVFPKPQRMFDPASPDYPPGGAYLEMPEGRDVTGRSPAQANISIGPDGKPAFRVSPNDTPDAPSKAGGATVKTNLFKQSAGWKWSSRNEGVPDSPTLVSVTTGGKHYYVLSADFPEGVNLTRYADAPSEPRLRPTSYGDVEIGPQVGTISVRGREHPVYERASVVPKAKAAGPNDPPPGVDPERYVPMTPALSAFLRMGGT